jgi:hypothetical protein
MARSAASSRDIKTVAKEAARYLTGKPLADAVKAITTDIDRRDSGK